MVKNWISFFTLIAFAPSFSLAAAATTSRAHQTTVRSIILKSGPVADQKTDKDVLDQAREFYAQGQLEKAFDLYGKIPSTSDFWLDAIEERAWVSTRQKNYEKAMADLKSVTSAVWSSQVGPEAYMLSAFVALKICNYKEVIAKIDLFKTRMLPRVDALQSIATKPLSNELMKLTPEITQGRVTLMDLGQKAELYPRYFFRDKAFVLALKKQDLPLAAKRLQKLAEYDLKEIETNLKKMKIIEVELMQNILLVDSKTTSNKLAFGGIDKEKELLFPVNDDEVWVDEVGQFQVRAQTCLKNKGTSL